MGAAAVRFAFEDDFGTPTCIGAFETEATAAAAANGGATFNMSGQKVAGDHRGVVIVNGKKVLRK